VNAAALLLVVKFLAGGAAGLTVHEAGHVGTTAIFGAHPGVRPINYAGIPFFAITHQAVSRKREFVISSAGLWMQHADSEWILTARKNLRHESAPFLKGVLAFNTVTSAVYATAAFGTIGPPERDTLGIATSLGKRGWREPAIGVFVLAPAALDVYRYYRPDQKWAAWASRGTKAVFMALVLFAGGPVS
jgi:hypothetical protein